MVSRRRGDLERRSESEVGHDERRRDACRVGVSQGAGTRGADIETPVRRKSFEEWGNIRKRVSGVPGYGSVRSSLFEAGAPPKSPRSLGNQKVRSVAGSRFF